MFCDAFSIGFDIYMFIYIYIRYNCLWYQIKQLHSQEQLLPCNGVW